MVFVVLNVIQGFYREGQFYHLSLQISISKHRSRKKTYLWLQRRLGAEAGLDRHFSNARMPLGPCCNGQCFYRSGFLENHLIVVMQLLHLKKTLIIIAPSSRCCSHQGFHGSNLSDAAVTCACAGVQSLL